MEFNPKLSVFGLARAGRLGDRAQIVCLNNCAPEYLKRGSHQVPHQLCDSTQTLLF
ncbi:hypothetical protein Sjap_004711 [Stephania japonica]|uniref:Uncharacterized protein n=1 Tax=Stephania japonica TaxID=461633 RepID=A0AAP0K2P4_9MAGN